MSNTSPVTLLRSLIVLVPLSLKNALCVYAVELTSEMDEPKVIPSVLFPVFAPLFSAKRLALVTPLIGVDTL
jgi:hypothetical protein